MPRTIVGKLAARLATFAAAGGAIALVACGRIIPDNVFEPARPPAVSPDFNMRQCLGALDGKGVNYRRLPDEDKPGQCRVANAVQLLDFGVPTSGLGAMTCQVADRYTSWVMTDVEDAARRRFGANVVRIESFGTYSCRNIAGTGNISEHGLANAVDIAAFRLSNGRRISVLDDWSGGGAEARFLRDVTDSACERFGTVLTPDYNQAHRDHLHLDMASRRFGAFCR